MTRPGWFFDKSFAAAPPMQDNNQIPDIITSAIRERNLGEGLIRPGGTR